MPAWFGLPHRQTPAGRIHGRRLPCECRGEPNPARQRNRGSHASEDTRIRRHRRLRGAPARDRRLDRPAVQAAPAALRL